MMIIHYSRAEIAQAIQWLHYGQNNLGSIPEREGIFFSPPRPDRLWGPASYPMVSTGGKTGGVWSWAVTSIQRPG